MPRSSPKAVLLVDGYNIIGSWASLKHIRDTEGLEASRWALIEDLINYSALQGFSTQIVFDAHYQNTCAHQETITENLSVYYTNFCETADTYIEKVCANSRQCLRRVPQDTTNNSKVLNGFYLSRLIVATSDRAQQLTVVGYGAEWMSASQLSYEITATVERAKRNHKPQKQSNSRFLSSSLDPKARQRLAELRIGLKKT